jgi:hypothetical protein
MKSYLFSLVAVATLFCGSSAQAGLLGPHDGRQLLRPHVLRSDLRRR